MLKSITRCLLAVAISTSGVVASADVVIDTVPVGNAGNADDTYGYGGADYGYNIGKYEVTAGQYTAFLNAVAATDTYGLYSTSMWDEPSGCKIQRSGSPGVYTYSVAPDRANRPVSNVSFWDATRFANWLHNAQPTGSQGPGTTETGAYTLNGYNGVHGGEIQRNPGAQWALPSEDEWYKAAYHENDGVTGNYFQYPAGSDDVPSNQLVDPDLGNNANFFDGILGPTIGPPYYHTEVGDFENSESPYGTFDQGGNVTEWNESGPGDLRGYRGGFADYGVSELHSSVRYETLPNYEFHGVGFRVVQVPEPTSILLLALGALAVRRRR